jgi:uncharacterized protein (UPF0254 family)
MSRLTSLPGWIQFVIGVGTVLVTVTLAYASLQSDLRVEATERKAADVLQQQQQQGLDKDIHEIKLLLKEEFDRHHPRRE